MPSSPPLLQLQLPAPRRYFLALADLNETVSGAQNDLTRSMRVAGLLYPLIIDDTKPEVVIKDGNRRVQSARNLGWDEIEVMAYAGLTSLEWAVILAGAHNRNPNPVSEARQFARMLRDLTLEGISANCGVPISRVKARLQLLNLPEDVLNLVGSKHLSRGVAQECAKLTGVHAERAIAKIREVAAADQPFTATQLREVKVARREGLGALLSRSVPKPQPLFSPEEQLAFEVQALCHRRGVPLATLVERLSQTPLTPVSVALSS